MLNLTPYFLPMVNTYLDLNGLYDFGRSCTFVGDCIVSDTEFVSGLERLEKKILSDIEKIESTLDQ